MIRTLGQVFKAVKPHILILGNQTNLSDFLQSKLSQQGYRISLSSEQLSSTQSLHTLRPDALIMIMDLSASDLDLKSCRCLASTLKKTPIMLLGNNDIRDKIASLNVCADYYLSIPFS
ncbi:MAG: hypothetical protein AAFU78_09920, partial [Cyanobacteria bacterium J06633_2]